MKTARHPCYNLDKYGFENAAGLSHGPVEMIAWAAGDQAFERH